jgi:2'-5' RNA ligase
MPTQRLFLALSLPEPVRHTIAALATPLHGIRWTPAEQLHVTLRFLGEITSEQTDVLIDRLAAVRIEPFLLPTENVGAFPPKRPPRVLWVGAGSGHPRLHQLRQRVDDTLLAVGLDVDLRSFHPHITVARCDEGSASGAAHWLREHRDFAGPPFRVKTFDLFSSELRPGGAEHHLLKSFPLVAFRP